MIPKNIWNSKFNLENEDGSITRYFVNNKLYGRIGQDSKIPKET